MELSQQLSSSMKRFFAYMGLGALSTIIMACATTPAEPVDVASEQSIVEQDIEVEQLPLSSELVYYVLTAEVAGQRGEMGVAVDLYHKASELVDSSTLAGRSAQVATFTRDKQRINRALERWIEIDPHDADVYIMQAPFLMLEGDFDKVVNAVNKALALAPEKTGNYLTRISDNLSEITYPQQALETLKRLQAYQQGDTEARFAYARLATFYQRYDEAEPIINELLEIDDEREDFLIIKAEILQRTGKSEQAIKLLARAVKRDDASELLRFNYGKLLGENGKTEAAREVLEEIYLANPQNQDALFALGLLAMEAKQFKEAKSYFSRLLKMGDEKKQATYFMGLTEEMSGNTDAALVWFASVPSHSNRYDQAQTHYINLLAKQGQIDKARQHLMLLRSENPQRAVDYYLYEASFLREQGMVQEAFAIFDEALKRHPDNIELLYGRAMVAESLNRLGVLEEDLRTILQQDPNNAQALNALGYTLTDRTNRHEEALTLIKKALQIKPEEPFYLDSLGWVYYRLGDLQKAEEYLRQAVALREDVEFIAHLGEVLWQQGKQQQAIQMWQQGITLDADNKLLLETMKRFGQ